MLACGYFLAIGCPFLFWPYNDLKYQPNQEYVSARSAAVETELIWMGRISPITLLGQTVSHDSGSGVVFLYTYAFDIISFWLTSFKLFFEF